MTPPGPGLRLEYCFRDEGFRIVAGLDEAGRGAWAGPVAAGAVILPLERFDLLEALKGVKDSKECTPRQREALNTAIRAVAAAAAVGVASPEEVDQLGIGPATRLAMARALDALAIRPQALLIDYLRLRTIDIPQRSFPKGEHLSLSIAAASIVAKVDRDRFMLALDEKYPGYGLARNKGYGTKEHLAALTSLGPSPVHRHSFAPMRLHFTVDADENRPGS